MPARAYWKGYLRLSLVTIGIELYSAVSSNAKTPLHQIDRKSGKRIRYLKVAPGEGEVGKDDIVKGYAVGKDKYVLLSPKDLDAIKLESRSTIDLVQFVDHSEIDPRYFEKPYYVLPRDDEVANEGFAVIREALRRTQKIGLGQMATRGRDHIVAVRPCGNGLLLETLRYETEIKKSDGIFSDIPETEIDDEMLSLADELIERKTAPFDPSAFKSRYDEALKELIAEKRRKGTVKAGNGKRFAAGDNVVDLMEALKKSVEKGRPRKKAAGKAKAKGGRKTAKSHAAG